MKKGTYDCLNILHECFQTIPYFISPDLGLALEVRKL